jgi:general secretion pathway protein K
MRNPSERGMILVIVLWTVAAMTAIIVALSSFAQKNVALAAAEAGLLRREMALASGLEAAKAVVIAANPERRLFFDGEPVQLDLGDVLVEARIQDAASLLDLNRAPTALLEGLLKQLAAADPDAATLLKQIMILRANAEEKSGGDGDEARPGKDQSRAPQAKSATFTSPGEWAGLAGANTKALAALARLASLYSLDGKINPLAAPDLVLSSIPGLTPEHREAFKAARSSKRWQVPAVEQALAAYPDFLAVREASIFLITVEVLAAPGLPPGQTRSAAVILDAKSDVPFHTLYLSW